jgi:ribosomal protein L11 methyltransferase
MQYFRYQFTTPAEWRDVLLAYLGEMAFEVFEETDNGWDAYLPENAAGPELDAAVEALRLPLEMNWQKELVPHQNWNEVWESNFEPVLVDDFCGVRAEFHAPLAGVQHELVIQPRMAFGTGHHATTEMMMRSMRDVDFAGKRVLDFGCGTGILAILAGKLGATAIDAVDIEEEACDNSRYNAELNGVPQIRVYCGDLEVVPYAQCDILLANINRNVLLDTMQAMSARLDAAGTLLLSGILIEDVPLISAAAAEQGLSVVGRLEQGDWACLTLRRQK